MYMEEEDEDPLTFSDESDNDYESYSDQSDDKDDYSDEESPKPICDYVSEAKQIIFSHDEITVANALKLSAEYQEMLEIFKQTLESLIKKCNDKFKRNELLLLENNNKKVHMSNISYYQCGVPFFKNRNLFTSPINPEYLYRRNHEKEYFPLDAYENISCYWTSIDKVLLLQSVKKQILEILNLKTNNTRKTLKDLYNFFKKSKFNDIDWQMISVKELQSRHSAYACMAVWNGYLKPDIKRGAWTDGEEKLLLKAVMQHNGQDWDNIAKQLQGRSDFQCFVHYTTSLSKKSQVSNKKWTNKEDKLLLETVERYRIGSFIPWNKVTLSIPNRNKVQVYYRYMYSVNPSIKKGKFTEEEDCTIIAGVVEYGLDFKKWPLDFIPERTLIQIKKRYKNVLQYVGKYECWTHSKDKELMNLCSIYGENNFNKISTILKNFNPSRCRNRFKFIKNYLSRYPEKQLIDVPFKNKPITSKINKNNWLEKIINIKENTCNDKVMAKPFYTSMTAFYKKYIQFFQYNYYFRHGKQVQVKNTHTIYIINNLLDGKYFYDNNNINCNYNIHMKNVLKLCYNPKYDKNFHTDLYNLKNNFLNILPNWNTIVSLRSLAIMYSNEIKSLETNSERESISKIGNSKNSEDFCLNLFKKRFQSIFYWTIILSKIEKVLPLPLKKVCKSMNVEPIKINVTFINGQYEIETPISTNHNVYDKVIDKLPLNIKENNLGNSNYESRSDSLLSSQKTYNVTISEELVKLDSIDDISKSTKQTPRKAVVPKRQMLKRKLASTMILRSKRKKEI